MVLNWWLLLLTVTACVMSAPVKNDLDTATRYLRRYRYLNDELDTSEGTVLAALSSFQRDNDLSVTGKLDDATLQRMTNPTCQEMESSSTVEKVGLSRSRRYTLAQGVKWNKRDVTYSVGNSPEGITLEEVNQTLRRAFDSWQSVCGLTFTFLNDTFLNDTEADIKIYFRRRDHGDQQRFDGPGGILAHANIPFNNGIGLHGDIHFDIDENWVLTSGGTNLYQVALHEIGHTLALGHSFQGTVMHAFYPSTYNPHFQLTADDIMGAQRLYGPRETIVEDMQEPDATPVDDTCVEAVDAITSLDDGSVLAFVGQEVYYLINKNEEASGFPKTLVETFGDMMENVTRIDAAIYWPIFRKLYLFTGSIYYRYSISPTEPRFPRSPDENYPMQISRLWRGIPDDIEAATVTPDNCVYIFKGTFIYKFGFFNNQYGVLPGYPMPLSTVDSHWNTFSSINIEATMQWTDGNYYILSGDNYYLMNSEYEIRFPGYPKSLSNDWFGCDMMEQRV